MPQNLSDADCAELARLLRQTIGADPYPLSPRVQRWRELLAKLDPSGTVPSEPFPAPKAASDPSRLRGKGRR